MDHSHHAHHGTHDTDSLGMRHDHGGGEPDGGDGTIDCSSMHAMVFHSGVCQYILFPGVVTTSVGELFGACVVIFLAALLYEGLRCWREILFLRGAKSNEAPSQVNIAKSECGENASCTKQTIVRYQMISTMHMVQTLLHMLQVLMSYLLMLVFMTYNVWLCIALILGAGTGYFVFAWRKQTVVELTEHCH